MITDLILGSIVGLCTWPWNGPWAILVAAVCAGLWALGGKEGHSWRVWPIPAVLCLPIALSSSWWAVLPYPWMALMLSLGYGLPSTQPPDEGGSLGRIWWAITDENETWATVGARGTVVIGILLGMTAWIPYLHHAVKLTKLS